MPYSALPRKQGLYDPRNEHDSCGIGFVANIKNVKSHEIVLQGLKILENLTHRGAVGADPLAGDGSGILIQIPDGFFRPECAALGFELPEVGDYGVGMLFLPRGENDRARTEAMINELIESEGQSVLGWRDVPTDNSLLGESVKVNEPVIRQVFVAKGENCADTDSFERKLFIIRKQMQRAFASIGAAEDSFFYGTSMSARTICYKGILLAGQVSAYYRDLVDERTASALALVHQRFSTNTFPTWELAQPFRMICHNGEINTKRGNENWMTARRSSMKSELIGDDLEKLWPLIREDQSDSASFDNALELLVAGGYSLAHAMMLMIPEAWDGNPLIDEKRRAFYEYYAALMEPWDGPAAVAFTDGRQIGATLDRNGLRPARYLLTDDDLVIAASETGVLDIPEANIVKKWRLQPGKMFLADLEQGRIIDDEELKAELAGLHPYQDWLDASQTQLEDLPPAKKQWHPLSESDLLDKQQSFGYSQEDVKFFLKPLAEDGEDPIGSMGTDTPISVLSDRPKLLYTYFKQNFAQVTNPPIDPIREQLVMSLVSLIGPRPNLLELNQSGANKRLEVHQPILTNEDMERIREIELHSDSSFVSKTLDITYPVEEGVDGLARAVTRLCNSAEEAVRDGINILILSDRNEGSERIPVPALLAVSGVHHHLVRGGLRTEVGLVVETGEAREVHHMCALAGYGAEAINPYLAFETLLSLRPELSNNLTDAEIIANYIKGIGKGILKVMSKMGISTYQSYCGAQIFDAVGLSTSFVDQYFSGTATQIEGIGIEQIAAESVKRHEEAYGDQQILSDALDVGGEFAFRIRGEAHVWSPKVISKMQHAVRSADRALFDDYARDVNEQNEKLFTMRGLFGFNALNDPISIDEVEPVSEIVKRFATGAMSFGSISREAHTNLAIAMNRLGGKSNTGEGGEERDRFTPLPNGDSMRSAIKQVASGRFGVTAEYLVNADDIQIKMAQGAKPGEGGQLPGHKVDQVIADVRHSTPGVGLISPPPHHDIYSIEDLAQLIHDLKNVNPMARISVKLVSEVGVGTVAAGVSKAHADHVTISGYEGGTGASPLTSIKHAGSPWEIGLAETHQTLVLHRLRGRIAVQVDGGFRTGRDVIIGAILGADEFGFATAPLIASGCVMMRKCHLNTCPVGVATQDPELRKRFVGEPEHVINFFTFIAEQVREQMAELGFRTINELIGRTDVLNSRKAVEHWKANGLDFTNLFYQPKVSADVATYNSETQEHGLENALDNQLIRDAKPAIESGARVELEVPARNINRTVGAMLSGEVARQHGHEGLGPDSIHITMTGTGGQSFGAFLARGVTIELTGDANDYVGKGLAGGRLIIKPPAEAPRVAEENIIIGNTVLYGATEGECFFRGVAGERFCVRNSGATAVVEGVGDHGCEYMTGGITVVLGETGRNFAAGMSGGIAYVLDEKGDFDIKCNQAMVTLEQIDANEPRVDAAAIGNPLAHDAQRLKGLIEQHLNLTGSTRAKQILDNWAQMLPKFVKILPVDYKRALEEATAKPEETTETVQSARKRQDG